MNPSRVLTRQETMLVLLNILGYVPWWWLREWDTQVQGPPPLWWDDIP